MDSKAHDDLNSIVISDTVLTAVTLMCSLKYVTFFSYSDPVLVYFCREVPPLRLAKQNFPSW